jgi:hypothetical protein
MLGRVQGCVSIGSRYRRATWSPVSNSWWDSDTSEHGNGAKACFFESVLNCVELNCINIDVELYRHSKGL